MLHHLLCITVAALLAAPVSAVVKDDSVVVNDSATAILTYVSCAEVKTKSASEITCFLAFPDSVPRFFYEVDSAANRVVIKLLDTRVGGMMVSGQSDTVNLGPIAGIVTREEIQNKNEAVKALNPEWYYVVIVTISCNPMIKRQKDLIVSQIENAISISFPWPEDPAQRKKDYFFVKKPRRTGLIVSLIGVGTAGLAAGGYYYYRHYYQRSGTAPGELEPVLPDHPSAP